ncbi:MAG: SUMF1/EgtB/PvdO family nonheme iron enzyme [Spirochaetes bacterium]|nr:SUMF1/EgtB/PvdO family nonheme iron enzyme [Spirochaetota bacterium]
MKHIISIVVFLGIIASATGCKKTSESFNPLLLLGGGTVTVPAPPGAATVTPGDEQLSLAWTAVAGATAYEVWFSSSSDSGTALLDEGDIVGTTHIIDGLSNSNPYYVWLKAKNSAGTSEFGPMASGTPQYPVPAPPGAVRVVPGQTSLSLSWNAVSGATAYEIWYNEVANDLVTNLEYLGENITTSFTWNVLTTNNTYYIWLKAKNPAYTSDFGPVAIGIPVLNDVLDVDGVSYKMIRMDQGGIDFFTGVNDGGSASLFPGSYFIGETEVTYELWYEIYTWAIDTSVDHDGDSFTFDDDGDDDVYTFANTGIPGNDGTAGTETTSQEPVTTINWRSAMVWCNALTEWYNLNNGADPDLGTAYRQADTVTPIRSVNDGAIDLTPGAQDNPNVDILRTGFRLPTSDEWEFFARYIDDQQPDTDIRDTDEYFPGDHVSGDITGHCYPDDAGTSTVFGDYAVYYGNSGLSTAAVKSKLGNPLGIFDMGGNVYEWCFDWHPDHVNTQRVYRGGSWARTAQHLQLGYESSQSPNYEIEDVGFRVVRYQ